MPMKVCPRCTKCTDVTGAHTCKPTEGWLKLEARIEELDDFRVRVAKALGIPAEASDDHLIDTIERMP